MRNMGLAVVLLVGTVMAAAAHAGGSVVLAGTVYIY
jgi:hypothetical protein